MAEEWTDSDADLAPEIVRFFGGQQQSEKETGLVPPKEAPPARQIAEVLGAKELTAQLLAEYDNVSNMVRDLTKMKSDLRYQILQCLGNDESAQRGDWVVKVKTRKAIDVDWKGLLEDYSGRETLDEVEQIVRAVREGQMVHPRVKLNESDTLEVTHVEKAGK